ncbi:hypothetical protein F4775DRAFT_590384 [Biscogniauxia sp. FL1348]|nr:hypothetical protein F4775DRAFT_590384 [Biscogniauxia sp. FL1348]
MLVTRQFDTEPSHWSSKFETALHKPTSSRMSSYDGSLSTQPEWQGHYSFLPPGENSIFAQPFEQVTGTGNNNESQPQQRSSARNNSLGTPSQASQSTGNSPISHQRPLDPLGLRQPKAETPTQEQSGIQGTAYAIKAESANEEALSSAETPGISLESNPISSVSSAGQVQDIISGASGNEEGSLSKEDDDEILDDDEMMEGDGETSTHPQTAAERTAARRKMKRFRLTHQQTRFLMSEFAKQPHPDAAHRERLSREIPGLSPRQVQVWFQNRRAKIKRLTADDRDRMIKMRAVPDDFDNVQALHSPYGAVHALATPITPPVDFNASSYADHMIRPLMVDPMRRGEGEDHISPTGLSSAFGGIGFTPTTSISNPDILSPLSPSSDRSYFSSHLTSPLGAAPRTSNPFARQNSLDTTSQMHSQSRHQIRPLQPLQLRETMSRSRSDNLQSPLRSRIQSSSSNINYSSLQQSSQNRSRLRAATATLPLGLDLRHQYRPSSNNHGLQSPAHTSTPRTPSTTSYGSSSVYTSSFPSAPLSAPIDFALSRTSGIRNSVPDYSMPQLSAPIAPSQDFSQALHGNMGNSNTRTPMRDTFGGGPLGISQGQGSGERSEDYSQEAMNGSNSDLKHKRSSFSLPQGRHTPGPVPTSQSYGHTT